MSTNLSLDQLTDGQAAPEVTVNNATGKIDAALTETLTVDGTADSTVSDTNWRQHAHLLVNNVSNAARQVTVPAIKKFMLIESDAGNTTVFNMKRGTALVPLNPGDKLLVYADGSSNGLAPFGRGGATKDFHPPDLTLFSITANGTSVTQSNNFDANRGLSFQRTDTGSGGADRLAFLGKAVPAGTWTATCRLKWGVTVGNEILRAGMCVSDGTKYTFVGMNNQAGTINLVVIEMTDANTFSSTPFVKAISMLEFPQWLRIVWGGTNYDFEASFDDGVTWQNLQTLAAATIGTATRIGVALETFGAITANYCGLNVKYWDDPDFVAP